MKSQEISSITEFIDTMHHKVNQHAMTPVTLAFDYCMLKPSLSISDGEIIGLTTPLPHEIVKEIKDPEAYIRKAQFVSLSGEAIIRSLNFTIPCYAKVVFRPSEKNRDSESKVFSDILEHVEKCIYCLQEQLTCTGFPCQNCDRNKYYCHKLSVVAVSTDQDATFLLSSTPNYNFFPDLSHMAKCIRNSAYNYYCSLNGSAFNVPETLRCLYYSQSNEIRNAVLSRIDASVIINRDKHNVPSLEKLTSAETISMLKSSTFQC